MPIPESIQVLILWRVIADTPEVPNCSNLFSARLESELPQQHILHGLKVRAVATRIDCDEVLFEIEGGQILLAVVHMTWRKETDPQWPGTTLFQSWDDWVTNEMLPAHDDYTS